MRVTASTTPKMDIEGMTKAMSDIDGLRSPARSASA